MKVIHVICVWIFLRKLSAIVIDEKCKIDCACCIDRECAPGKWFCNECTLGCIDGHRGGRCYERCTHNCTKCDNRADTCTACYGGYYPGPVADCTSKCLPGCKTCTSGINCTSCKDEYYNDNGRIDCSYRYCPENCYCENKQCVSCKDGYYDTSKSCNSLCPGNCITCLSDTDCGSCKDGYYKGYRNDNINPRLFTDCTNKCPDNCVRCLSYDSCSVCKIGFYGANCENTCSTGCTTNTCDILTGNCNCFSNFAGERCDKCETGKYGNLCDQQCPMGCKGNVCEKDTGDCTDGCTLDRIIGDKCDICPAEQRENTSIVVLGTLFAVSLMGNILLVTGLVLLKYRKRATNHDKKRGQMFENSGIDLEWDNVPKNTDGTPKPSTSDNRVTSREYEDLGDA
ncbi:cell death abnormality protein 1-like isoform X2 [Ruditapes philippinarum]|uniref:cell death abnormality protein 1-like isoform X2 n=1 Tax=Ruditapes philippinarum TaxID=129788 RepID=UPI00295AB3E1|nr:cell death abnormality protein 1-like isoform X2 [Ruditapes philippinarum]